MKSSKYMKIKQQTHKEKCPLAYYWFIRGTRTHMQASTQTHRHRHTDTHKHTDIYIYVYIYIYNIYIYILREREREKERERERATLLTVITVNKYISHIYTAVIFWPSNNSITSNSIYIYIYI